METCVILRKGGQIYGFIKFLTTGTLQYYVQSSLKIQVKQDNHNT